mmetsp:Transcript_37603/g.90226  ORF Transcript_37603/g.90226 Transcript_37603/m.90226 type:complete len:242 (-) Transcript_37603:503-1228(-)
MNLRRRSRSPHGWATESGQVSGVEEVVWRSRLVWRVWRSQPGWRQVDMLVLWLLILRLVAKLSTQLPATWSMTAAVRAASEIGQRLEHQDERWSSTCVIPERVVLEIAGAGQTLRDRRSPRGQERLPARARRSPSKGKFSAAVPQLPRDQGWCRRSAGAWRRDCPARPLRRAPRCGRKPRLQAVALRSLRRVVLLPRCKSLVTAATTPAAGGQRLQATSFGKSCRWLHQSGTCSVPSASPA